MIDKNKDPGTPAWGAYDIKGAGTPAVITGPKGWLLQGAASCRDNTEVSQELIEKHLGKDFHSSSISIIERDEGPDSGPQDEYIIYQAGCKFALFKKIGGEWVPYDDLNKVFELVKRL